jgi:uncharacterized protein GlcG (DUF336 family)
MKLSHKYENIDWQAAHEAVQAAVTHAREIDVHIAAAVVDNGGNLVAFLRSDQGPYMSVNIAIDKAYTSASFSVPTSQWGELLPSGSILREAIVTRDRFVAFGGGVPIIVDGECFGAIGVSGASEEQDEACAQAGLNAIIN